MSGMDGADGYAVNAQYYDLIFPDELRRTLRAALRGLLADAAVVLEIGAGTGQFTEAIAAGLPPGGEVFAVEPAAVMRAALATRLAALGDPPVTILPDDALSARVDRELDAVVALNVLPHFDPEVRAATWARWVPALRPGGVVVVDVPAPQEAVAVPESVIPGRRLGRRCYDTLAEATVDGDRLVWTMTYRVHEDGHVVSRDVVSFPSVVVSESTLDSELAAVGCEPVVDPPVGVLAWRKRGP